MEEDVCEEYKSSLLDLTCNSKPLINMLTMLAEENVQQAPRIVRSIEEHLQKVPIEMKLPVLYLIDSIMKNVGGDYRALFTQNIVSNFCNVFEKGDERMRMQLFKLRQTWVDIFPNKKLYALDTRVKQMDPAWPIMAKEPQQTSIHVNPKFLEAKTKGQEQETLEQQAAKLASLNALNKATADKQLLKSLKPPSSVATTHAPTPTPVPAGVAARPQMPRPPVPIAARDPRLQQRSMPSADISRPPPVSSASSVQPVQLGSVIVAPAQGTTTNTASCTPVTVSDQAPPDKHGNNRLSAREKHAAIKSPPRKFRIPKTSDRKKDEDNGSKNGEVEPSSPTKTSPSKSRKSAEDRDERQQRGRAGSVGKSSSSSSSSSSSQSRGGKKGRGKNGKSKSEENVRPNGDVEMMDVLPSGDVDMRVQVEKKRDSTDTTQDAPLHKRQRGHAEEGLADFDYRKPPDRPGGFTNASQRGWAQYKAKHPDEFKSPLRPARENMDVRDEDLRQMQDSAGRGAYQGRGPMQPFVDRFGRPVLRKLMTDPRFRTHVGQSGNSDMSLQQQMYEMLADPDVFLQQTDEQMRAGRLNPDLHRELKAELEKISQFRKSQPQSPIMPLNWQGGPPGPGFPPWNQPSFGGMTTGMPPLCEPAPSVGTIRVDTKMRKVQFVDDVAVVLMDGSETRQIMFKGPPKRVFIDDMEPISLPFDGTVHEFVSKRTGKKRTIKFGAPLREIFLDGVPYSAQFDNSPIAIKTADGEVHVIRLEPQPPTVDIEKRPPEHVLRALNLHPEKLADTDSDLRTLPPEVKLPATEGENSMDVDMRLPASEGAKDVDLRKRGDMDESGTSWNSPQQAGVGWGQSRPQQPTEGGFQQSKESGGWVRYGSTSEERTAVSSNWPQQPPLGQPQQDPNIRPPWPPGPGEWNNNFGVGEVRPGFLQPQFPPCRPPFTAGDPAPTSDGPTSAWWTSTTPSSPSGIIELGSPSATCTTLHGGYQAAPSGA
ncbi:hypothetical protein HPB50_001831 [Hyalomma asiaticum]|uniref:Uncharacterized protein n=1 Tax=Hyalomma asiaticum TaxID=266040 RepID=A0ACB7SK12_HYAAI|nr:hypothetical protein HPB50_001831 [Hyalomma asiaticum]